MSEQGMRIWDANSRLTFAETDFTMRVLGKLQLRYGFQSGTIRIDTPLGRPGVYAIVNVLPGSYTQWGTNVGYKRGVRASLPTVSVVQGAIILSAPARATYLANIDVILVGTQ